MSVKDGIVREALRSAAAHSSYDFLLQSWHINDPSTPLVPSWFMRLLCKVIDDEIERVAAGLPKKHDYIINVPPRSLKSTILSINPAPKAWIKHPTMRFIYTSYNDEVSRDMSIKARRIIESPWYQENWGHLYQLSDDQNRQNYFETTKGGKRMSTSTGGGITGKGAHMIFMDDPQDPRRANSEVERLATIEYFKHTLSTRLDDPSTGVFFLIMQRLHENDLTGYLLSSEPERWRHICLPAEDDPEKSKVKPAGLRKHYRDGLLFPERFTPEVLALVKSRMGSREYSGQYGQSPKKTEGNILKGNQLFTFRAADLPATYTVDFAIDSAYTEDKDNDPSCILTYTKHDGRLFILGISLVRKDFPAFCQHLIEYCTAMGADDQSTIAVEPKATGKSIVQQLRGVTPLSIIEDVPPTSSKVERAHSITPKMEAGRVGVPAEGSRFHGPWVEAFILEIENFPLGAHDDQVDCLTMAVRRGLRVSAWDNPNF